MQPHGNTPPPPKVRFSQARRHGAQPRITTQSLGDIYRSAGSPSPYVLARRVYGANSRSWTRVTNVIGQGDTVTVSLDVAEAYVEALGYERWEVGL
jgi:hypothetical protein